MSVALQSIVNLLIIGLFVVLLIMFSYYMTQQSKFHTLKRKLDHYHLLASKCQWIFFEYDCECKKLAGINQRLSMHSYQVHQDDLKKLALINQRVRAGEMVHVNLRLYSGKEYHWYQIHLLKNDSNIIGMLMNIDAEQQEQEKLKEKACLDSMTGFYNKMITKRLIDEWLLSADRQHIHALMLLDIDNFKALNDEKGHYFGDEVLINFTKEIRKLFRSSDILGRIGGDEFVIFMKDASEYKIKERAAQICEFSHQGIHMSVSIGVAYAFKEGDNFEALYVKADQAMYHVKRSGKNGFKIC